MKAVQRRRQKGQLSLLMMMSIIPTLTLFAFVINVGMLVHAKINLQNAADAAAFAGAANQGRLLTRISHLNYLMRMNYKKFIFKYYVLGNMALKCFPGSTGSSSPTCTGMRDDQDFDFTNPPVQAGDGPFPTVPSVCFFYDNSNICQLNASQSDRLEVRDVPCPPGDSVCTALNTQLGNIREIQRLDCSARGTINADVAQAWIYNTDADPMSGSGIQSFDRVRGLIGDLGLVPANIFLRTRIKTLENYVNTRPQNIMSTANLRGLESAPDLARTERAILAYKSALGMLSAGVSDDWGVFERDSLTLEELVPTPPTNMLRLTDIAMPRDFTIFFTYSGFDVPYGLNNPTNANTPCGVRLATLPVPGRFTYLGVYKNPESRVYYGVRLSAKPKLLFNPFSEDLTLTAYAAAAPFGSRIGPKITEAELNAQFLMSKRIGTQEYWIPTAPFSGNLKYTNIGLLRALFNTIHASTGFLTDAVTTNLAQAAWETAMGPDPDEIGKYNIPVHLNVSRGSNINPATRQPSDNGFNRYFGSNHMYNMWAPLTALDSNVTGSDVVRDIIAAIETQTGPHRTTVGSDPRVALANTLERGLNNYMANLAQSRSPDQNTLNTVAMINPLKQLDLLNTIRVGSDPNARKYTTPEELATSWWSESLKDNTRAREGYSVKFVPFSTITGGGGAMRTASFDRTPWTPLSPQTWGAATASDITQLSY